ncbi:MAG: serine hydrolase [Candidatus Omnitrophota bacterium]
MITLATSAIFSYKIYEKNLFFSAQLRLFNRKKEGWNRLKKTLENKVAHFKGTVGLVVEDLNTGWVIALNENVLIPSASLVKVPIMLAYFYAAQENKINLDDDIKFKSFQRIPTTKLQGRAPVGRHFMVEELFDPMITVSNNDAANALINLLGFDTLNDYFKKMGLKNTNISRNMLDFKSRREGLENYTTAKDTAYLLEKLYRRQFLSQEVSEKCLALLNQQKINDRIPRKLPDDISVAHKTGLERHICHDAGIVYTPKGDFLICVLVKHRNRFAKPAKKLISEIALATYNYYNSL